MYDKGTVLTTVIGPSDRLHYKQSKQVTFQWEQKKKGMTRIIFVQWYSSGMNFPPLNTPGGDSRLIDVFNKTYVETTS